MRYTKQRSTSTALYRLETEFSGFRATDSLISSAIFFPALGLKTQKMEAYAKLVDRNSLENDEETQKREFLITELPCSLGRVNLPPGQSFSIVIDENDVLLSRQHAEIQWSQETEWSLVCLSKNGLFVDDVKYKKDEHATLHDGSDIRLGNSFSRCC